MTFDSFCGKFCLLRGRGGWEVTHRETISRSSPTARGGRQQRLEWGTQHLFTVWRNYASPVGLKSESVGPDADSYRVLGRVCS